MPRAARISRLAFQSLSRAIQLHQGPYHTYVGCSSMVHTDALAFSKTDAPPLHFTFGVVAAGRWCIRLNRMPFVRHFDSSD